jgi:hypothetical protein
VSCRDNDRSFVRERRTAVAAEVLTGRILGAAFRTATAKRRAAVPTELFAVRILGAAAGAAHRLTRKNKRLAFLYHAAPGRSSVPPPHAPAPEPLSLPVERHLPPRTPVSGPRACVMGADTSSYPRQDTPARAATEGSCGARGRRITTNRSWSRSEALERARSWHPRATVCDGLPWHIIRLRGSRPPGPCGDLGVMNSITPSRIWPLHTPSAAITFRPSAVRLWHLTIPRHLNSVLR